MKQKTITRSFLALGAAAVFATSLTGCSIPRTDVWTVVYKVSTDSDTTPLVNEISYAHTPDPETKDKPETRRVTGADVTPDVKEDGLWWGVGAITAHNTASITATPAEGVRATCKILLDGTTELASKTGEPGKPVTCDAKTPKRSPGVFRNSDSDEKK
jgi:hypothetical protein